MNTETIKKKLVALEAKVDAVLFRSYYDDEEERGTGMLKVGVGAAGLGAGAFGAYKADQAIMRRYGMMPGVGRREAYRRAGVDAVDFLDRHGMADASRQAQRLKATGQRGMAAGQKAYGRAGAQGAGLFSRLRRAVGSGLRAATMGRVGFDATERLMELAYGEKKPSYAGSAVGGAAKGAVAGGALGAVAGTGLGIWGIKTGALHSASGQKLLRLLRSAGVPKKAAPAAIAGAVGAYYGPKAAKYGAAIGAGAGIASAARSRREK